MNTPQKYTGGAASPRRTSVRLRGLFVDGSWRCDCPDRPPAVKLQTKGHGVNHLRWYYTCQHPAQHRCKFFLWASDAEMREKGAVISNSRTEPAAAAAANAPKTPSRLNPNNTTGLLTPQTDRPIRTTPASRPRFETPSKSAKARMMSEDMDEFEWDDTADMGKYLDRPPQPNFGSITPSTSISLPHTQSFSSESDDSPRKAARTDSFASPRKRKLSDIQIQNQGSLTPTSPFTSRTESWHMPPPSTGDMCLTPTPTKYRNPISPGGLGESSDLALQTVKILESHGVVMPRRAQEELMEELDKYERKTKGISRGRDLSRMALKKKDDEIEELKGKVAALEAQRERVLSGLMGK